MEKKSNLLFYLAFLSVVLIFTNAKLNVIDGYTQYLAVKNIVERGTFEISEANPVKYPAQFFKGKNGGYYSIFQPGSVVLLVPFYIIGKICVFILPDNNNSETIIKSVVSFYPDISTSFIVFLMF